LPRSNVSLFVGRNDALSTLHEQLQTKERVAISTLSGMGGIGKTELALQYAITDVNKAKNEQVYVGGICWLNAADNSDVGLQILNFARVHLGLNIPDEGGLKDRVRYCWLNWPVGDVLVIFDDVGNYEKIAEALPPSEQRFKVIITTRKDYLTTSFELLRLPVLDEEPSLDLLGSFIGEERVKSAETEAKNICQWLGYLPLALELVGRFLKRKKTWSLGKLLERLKERSLDARSLQELSPEMKEKRGVAAAFELSWDELDEAAQSLGCFLSLFALSPIPWELIREAFSEVDEDDLEDSRDDYLINLNLIEDKGEESYELHPLIREFFRQKLRESGEIEAAKQRFYETLIPKAKVDQTLTITDIQTLSPFIPHLIVIAEEYYQYLADDDLIWGFEGLARYYENQGLYDAAIPWGEECLNVIRERFGAEHPDVATSLNNLALLYESQGKYEAAEPLYIQALAIAERTLGENHPNTNTIRNNYQYLLDNKG
jgi:tetratricopeptide (TPR) repeat protein